MADSAPTPVEGQAGGRKKWMALVMAEKKAHPGWSLGQAMKSAKKKYRKTGKKTRRGGGVITPLPLAGGRRRSRSRKH